MKRKKWLVLFLFCNGLFFLTSCTFKEEKKESQNNEKYIIGIDDTFVPMGFRDEKNHLKGYDIDLARSVLKGKHFRFQTIDWSMKESELNNGTIDLIWNGYSVNEVRKKKVDFVHSYMTNHQVLVVLKEKKITSYKDMTNKVLGVQEGSSGFTQLEEKPNLLLKKIKHQRPILYSSFNEAFLDLNYHRIDGLLIDEVYAKYYLNTFSKKNAYRICQTPFPFETFAVAIKKGNPSLAKVVQEGFKRIEKNGEKQKIDQKWFATK